MKLKQDKQRKRILNRELPVFTFFLLLSFIFWYLNELSKDLQGTINYPVRYINPPMDRIVTGNLPDKLEMNLRGPGYSILKMRLSGSRAPVVIDFSRVTPRRLPGSKSNYFLVTSGMIQDFSKQLHADFEILSVHPDTLFFGYDRIITRKVMVMPDIVVEPSSGRKVIIVPDPDSVSVTGPAHIVDTLKGIPTRHRTFKRMSENFKSREPLECPDYLEMTQKKVMIEVTIADRTSSLFMKNEKDK
jgi:hypothetical protein